MRVCDRCRGVDGLEGMTISVSSISVSVQWFVADLCNVCRKVFEREWKSFIATPDEVAGRQA